MSVSQSVTTFFTWRKWPELSPLFHSFCRLRLQNQAVLVSRVRYTASRLVKPSISTSRVSSS